jgi:hypothetical protein
VRAFFCEALPQLLGGSVVFLLPRPRRARPFSVLEVATAQPAAAKRTKRRAVKPQAA